MPLKSATCGRELEAGLRGRQGSNNVTFDGKTLDGVFVMHRRNYRARPRPRKTQRGGALCPGPKLPVRSTYREVTQIRGINWHHPMKRTAVTLYLITVSLLLVARRKTPHALSQTSCKSCESVSFSAANRSSG